MLNLLPCVSRPEKLQDLLSALEKDKDMAYLIMYIEISDDTVN